MRDDKNIFKTNGNIESLRNKLLIHSFLLLSIKKQTSKEHRHLIKKKKNCKYNNNFLTFHPAQQFEKCI